MGSVYDEKCWTYNIHVFQIEIFNSLALHMKNAYDLIEESLLSLDSMFYLKTFK